MKTLRFEKGEDLLVLLLRFGMGWIMLYAGLSKLVNPAWTAAPQLAAAHYLPDVMQWLMLPDNLGWLSFIVEWGLTLIGLGLIIGLATRYASWFGILAVLTSYIVDFNLPHITGAMFRSFIVDEHIIYVLVFLLLIGTRAGETWGIDRFLKDRTIRIFRKKPTTQQSGGENPSSL